MKNAGEGQSQYQAPQGVSSLPELVIPSQSRRVGGPLTSRDMLALLVATALIALGWANTFSEMWNRWFPAWNTPAYADSLSKRLTEGGSYYTHGPLVLIVSLGIAWWIYRRVGWPIDRTRAATILGWLLLGGSLLMHLMSVYARVTFVSGFAMIGVLGGLVLIWGGFALARAYWLPIAFLAFMIPLPMSMIADLNLHLKFTAGRSALWLTNNMFGIPAFMDGSYVYLRPDDPEGPPKFLVIEDVCSGLRSLISLICFASLFALICRVKGFWRLFMLAMAVPIAIATNIVRITTLNVVAHHWGVEMAGPDSTVHDMSGLLVFALALAMLMGMEHLIVWMGKWLKRDWTDQRLLGYLEHVRAAVGQRAAMLRPATLSALAVVAVLSLLFARTSIAEHRGDIAAKAVATTMTVNDTPFQSIDLELDDLTLTILETRDYLYRRFNHPPTRQWMDLMIVFSADNRKGTHPPEVCLAGAGDQVVTKNFVPLTIDGVGTITMCELVTQNGTRLTYHLYIYKSGDSYTASFLRQQAMIFINGLLARNTAGAQIRFSAPVENADVDAARALAIAAAYELMPQIDQGLP
jgi:EpsI family protein